MDHCLGVLYEEYEVGLMHHYFSPILKSFRDTAEQSGYAVCFLSRKFGNEQLNYTGFCGRFGISGVAVISGDFFAPDTEELLRSDIPCVTIDHVYHGHTCVISGNRRGISQLMNLVLDMGHKNIAYVTGTNDDVTRVRQAGVLRAVSDAGLTISDEYLIHAAYHDPDVSYAAVRRLLALPVPPTCILMPDDISALGGIRAIKEAGLCPGKDVSIVGFDGAPLVQLLSPRITTVRQDTEAMGRYAAEKLIERIEKPEYFQPEIISVPCSIVEGETLYYPKG